MANVPHSTLTGSDLHIIKGADTAAAGQVPIATGSGDAPFGKLTHTSLQTTGNAFGAQLLHIQDDQGVGGGPAWTIGSTAGWKPRILNSAPTNEISGASIGANTITLPAGTYFLQAFLANPTFTENGSTHYAVQSRFYNNSDATTALAGVASTLTTDAGGDTGASTIMEVGGRFTITSQKAFQFYTYYKITNSTSFSTAANTGVANVYLDAYIWKLA